MVKSELWISLEFKKTLIHLSKVLAYDWSGCVHLLLYLLCTMLAYAWISEGMLEFTLVWAKGRFLLGSYSQRTLGLGTLVSFFWVGIEIDCDGLLEFYMHNENIIRVGLEKWISFSRDEECASIKIGVHFLLILSFSVILVLINLVKVKDNIILRNNFIKKFCVKGDLLSIGLSKVCDRILGKEVFFYYYF